jgi:hypothetical protein
LKVHHSRPTEIIILSSGFLIADGNLVGSIIAYYLGIRLGRAFLIKYGKNIAAHGGNRTGRMFTGDSSEGWIAKAMFELDLQACLQANQGMRQININRCIYYCCCKMCPAV